jgi:hypothetical protein
MISYQYSEKNRFDEPHHYMYTPFQGGMLLASYRLSRLDLIRNFEPNQIKVALDANFLIHTLSILEGRLNQTSPDIAERFFALLKIDNFKMQNSAADNKLTVLANRLRELTILKPVKTEELLHALVSVLLISDTKIDATACLDRLVQRFEVLRHFKTLN